MNTHKKFKMANVILWAVCILLGIFLIIQPAISVKVVGYVFGGIILIMGLCRVFGSFTKDGLGMMYKFDLINGVINIMIGVFILVRPQVVLSILPIIVGIAVVVESLFKIQNSLAYKKAGYSKWWISFIIGILTLIIGGVLIFNPFKTMVITVRIIGIALCILGIFNVSSSVILSKKVEQEERPTYIDIE